MLHRIRQQNVTWYTTVKFKLSCNKFCRFSCIGRLSQVPCIKGMFLVSKVCEKTTTLIILYLYFVEIVIFNARAQRSWRRRLWHRPRTPSSSPSWRPLRLDTIWARITKFGSEGELDERCSHAKFDVTGYFRSPASGHLINIFSIFSSQYLRNG